MSATRHTLDVESRLHQVQRQSDDPPPAYHLPNQGQSHQSSPLLGDNPHSNYGIARTTYLVVDKAPRGNFVKSRGIVVVMAILIGYLIWGVLTLIVSTFDGHNSSKTPWELKPEEIEKYRRSGIFWDAPRPLDCLDDYHYRQYTAQLRNASLSEDFDITKACKALPIEIKGHLFRYPGQCQRSGAQMYGFWTVYDTSDCTVEDEIERYRNSGMFWDAPRPLECKESTYSQRQYISELRNISHSDRFDLNKVCKYLTIETKGRVFGAPDQCKQSTTGVLGLWTVYDRSECTIDDEYRNSGMFWDTARPSECQESIYSQRQYISQLRNISHSRRFNLFEACRLLPIEINGHTFGAPDQCKPFGSSVLGSWTIYDESECTIEDEKEKYRNSGMFWGSPKPAKHCYSYDKREYEAQLLGVLPRYDWNKACRYMPIRIHDQELEEPDTCEHDGPAIYGKWIASNQADCKPYWGPLTDVGCQASGKKRYEAPLWNLIKGDDWYSMCYSTPATWNGNFYPHPSTCDYRKRGGMTGIWEAEDCS